MAIAMKGKRPFVLKGRTYYWWAAFRKDPDLPTDLTLSILSEDEQFHVTYRDAQVGPHTHLVVHGTEFGDPISKRRRRRYLCPQFNWICGFQPGHVREILDWCQEPVWRPEFVLPSPAD